MYFCFDLGVALSHEGFFMKKSVDGLVPFPLAPCVEPGQMCNCGVSIFWLYALIFQITQMAHV